MIIKGKYGDAIVYTENIEIAAIEQIKLLLEQEFSKNTNIRMMPDVHAGKGCTIGTTMILKDKVCPNLVGVDIGCGMYVKNLGKSNLSLEKLDTIIKENVPSGFNIHEKISKEKHDEIHALLSQLRCFKALDDVEYIINSIGTLGGGNHFIELAKDSYDNEYLIIHTGSRHLGTLVAKYYQNKANKHCNDFSVEIKEKTRKLSEELIRKGRQIEIENHIKKLKGEYKNRVRIPKDLAYVEGKDMIDYLHDMKITQEYAKINREEIALNILKRIKENYTNKDNSFHTVHNYIDKKNNILRKGAISAQLDEIVLIPLNMRDGSLLCKGKGNPDWNYSGPHGAGRIMSRAKAKQSIKLEDFKKSMEGIYSTSVVEETLDESPFAYKDSETLMNDIGDTVEILGQLKPVYNYKAH